jgi:ATP-dependent Lhr-like helicase
MARAMRGVLLGEEPPVRLTSRARAALTRVRGDLLPTIHPGGTMLLRDRNGDLRWWTWGGFRTNVTLAATLTGAADPVQRAEDVFVRLHGDLTVEQWKASTADATERLRLPAIHEKALHGLKFSAALPRRLAEATLAARLADLDGAATVLREPTRWSA